jgi:hypothetical protein
MGIATTAFVTIGVVFDKAPIVWVCVFGLGCGLFRQLGRRLVRKGDVRGAVIVFTAGQWATTIAVVWVLPLALPVMLFNLVVPVLLGATYLDDRDHRPIAYSSMGVAGLMGVVGLTQDRFDLAAGESTTLIGWGTIVFLVGYTWMFTATVRDANRTRVATLERALTANDALAASQNELLQSRRRLV